MGKQVGEQAGESNILTSVHFLGLRLESGEEKQLGSGVARFHYSNIFPSRVPHSIGSTTFPNSSPS